MICFENVSYSTSGIDIINNVSFKLKKGCFTALIGANGAGKSTLARLCNGLLKPTSGSVSVGGFDTALVRTSRIAKFTGFLFQNPDRQICKNSVRDEIRFSLECVIEDKTEIGIRCEKTLQEFSLNGDRDPFSMSRGERQRLVLASILAAEPELLLLDEPTTGLDYRECMHIMECVSRVNKKGATVLMVSHDMEVVQDFASEVMVLNDGSLLAHGRTKDIIRNEPLLARASLLPPQITELAIRLGGGYENAVTVDDMVLSVKKHIRGAE
ncbi:MAG: ABC transporter ATP-binding protein [Synergistaceae bacterium]|nr:ABC transporter ATP-binding protein [Synergistaceae bacterium]